MAMLLKRQQVLPEKTKKKEADLKIMREINCASVDDTIVKVMFYFMASAPMQKTTKRNQVELNHFKTSNR